MTAPNPTPTTKPDFNLYRPNAGCVVVNADGKILIAERRDIPDAWQMPQGGIDPGEDPQTAATRELFEETAIQDVAVVGEYPHWLTYEFPPGGKKGHHIGQAQRWFLLRFTGTTIDLEKAVHPEFRAWKWATAAEVMAAAAPFRKPIYTAALRHFGLL